MVECYDSMQWTALPACSITACTPQKISKRAKSKS